MPPEFEKVSTSLRQEVAQRANHRCEYCLCPDYFSTDSFTVDHIFPKVLGGSSVSENLAWACFGCNGRKYAKTQDVEPKTNELTHLFHPRQQNGSKHFSWNDTLLLGLTPCGRATIESFALNRIGVVNLRQLLKLAGLHPPSIVS